MHPRGASTQGAPEVVKECKFRPAEALEEDSSLEQRECEKRSLAKHTAC